METSITVLTSNLQAKSPLWFHLLSYYDNCDGDIMELAEDSLSSSPGKLTVVLICMILNFTFYKGPVRIFYYYLAKKSAKSLTLTFFHPF